MADVKVTTKVDVQGLDEAVTKWGRFTGSITDTQRAMRQIGVIGQEAMRSGSVVTPQQMDRLVQNVEHLKRAEGEINRLLTDRMSRLNEIVAKNPVLRALVQQGVSPMEAITMSYRGAGGRALGGAVMGKEGEEAQRLPSEIARLQAQLARVREGIPLAEGVADRIGQKVGDAQTKALNQWLPRFGRVLRTSLGIIGIGGAAAIAAQARGRAIEFDVRAADIAAFLGPAGRGLRVRALRAAGAYGLYPNEALSVGEAIAAAGGRSTREMIERFAGMGLYLGVGRPGFARMGREGVSAGRFQNLEQFEQFGRTAGGLAIEYGLSPGQKRFFLESNKNLIEQMGNWYGGRPLNVESYFKGMNSLMNSMSRLGLPLAGAPIAMEVAKSLGGGLSPIGKGFGDVVRTGIMLGISQHDALATGKGLYFGYQQKINELMRSPEGFVGAIQGLARFAGIQTGAGAAAPTGGQLTALAALAGKVPGMLRALGILNTAGVPLERILQQEPGQALPKGLDEKFKTALAEAKGAAEDQWRRADINWVKSEIKDIGQLVKSLESMVKTYLSPTAAAGISAASGVVPLVGNAAMTYLGTRAALGLSAKVGLATLEASLGTIGGAAALLAAPFILSGERAGTHRVAPELKGQKLTPEEFKEMERKAIRGEIKIAPLGVPDSHEVALALHRLADQMERNSTAIEQNTEETKQNTSSTGQHTSEKRGVSTNKPMAP